MSRFVADLCLYGPDEQTSGWIVSPLGAGVTAAADVEPRRSRTDSILAGCAALLEQGVSRGLVRVFDPDGRRCAPVRLEAPVDYSMLCWEPAPMYTISFEELLAGAARVRPLR